MFTEVFGHLINTRLINVALVKCYVSFHIPDFLEPYSCILVTYFTFEHGETLNSSAWTICQILYFNLIALF